MGDSASSHQAHCFALLLSQGKNGGEFAPIYMNGQSPVDGFDPSAPGVGSRTGLGDEAGQAVGVLQTIDASGQEALESHWFAQHPPRVVLGDGIVLPAHAIVGKKDQVAGAG